MMAMFTVPVCALVSGCVAAASLVSGLPFNERLAVCGGVNAAMLLALINWGSMMN
jgi:hypothetical protein